MRAPGHGVGRAGRLKGGAAALILALAAGVAWAQGGSPPADDDPFAQARARMVEQQLAGRDITDTKILAAMAEVPRHLFVDEAYRSEAYEDKPLPLGEHQTVHQPYLVALMTELLELDRGAKVLEIGTGSGYHTAVLSKLAWQVFTIEIDPDLARAAKRRLTEGGVRNVHFKIGDGYQGWPTEAPFDAIILTTAPPWIPQHLVDQLKVGGRMVVPEGTVIQDLTVLTKTEYGYEKRRTIPVRVRPMQGEVAAGKP